MKSLYESDSWGRKPHKCAKCGNIIFSAWKCPKREKSMNEYICCRCCYGCGYSVNTEHGKDCSIKAKRRKAAEKERLKKKARKQHDEDAEFNNTSFFSED